VGGHNQIDQVSFLENRRSAERDVKRNARRSAFRGKRTQVVWDSGCSVALVRFTSAVVALHGSVLFSGTSHGDIMVINVYHRLLSLVEYIRPSDELAEVLDGCLARLRKAVRESVTDMPQDQPGATEG